MLQINDIENCINDAEQDTIEVFKQKPQCFFTENDITGYFLGRIHHRLAIKGYYELLAHMEYPTPFRCCMDNGCFCAKGESEKTVRGKKYQRGHFDLVVMNPDFLAECSSYSMRKGQKWEELRPFLEQRNSESVCAVIKIYELMFLRDPFCRDPNKTRGKRTLETVATLVKQDWEKAEHALKPMENGFIFAQKSNMLIFINNLSESACEVLKKLVPEDVTIVSTSLPGRTQPSN